MANSFAIGAPPTDALAFAPLPQPRRKRDNQAPLIPAVRVNVLAGKVGDVALIAKPFTIKDDARLGSVLAPSESSCAKKHPKFKRHVETRQRRIAICFGARDIVNAIAAFVDNRTDLLKPIDGRIIRFESATRPETGSSNSQDRSVEKKPVAIVKWTINEYVAF
jgi:hypothetical protein